MRQETLYTGSYLLAQSAGGEQWAFKTLYLRYWCPVLIVYLNKIDIL